MSDVSVLMPCYNAAGTLRQALESLAQQTFADFELIAVNDGSTDGTHDALMVLANQTKTLITGSPILQYLKGPIR